MRNVVTSVYICVVATLACPNISCTDRKSAPFASRLVANVWRCEARFFCVLFVNVFYAVHAYRRAVTVDEQVHAAVAPAFFCERRNPVPRDCGGNVYQSLLSALAVYKHGAVGRDYVVKSYRRRFAYAYARAYQQVD